MKDAGLRIMICPACHHENRPGAKFCEECAAPLQVRCTSCGAELRPTAKFCDECGTRTGLGTSKRDAPANGGARAAAAAPAGARKVVTVVFADLAGSTALHERVDAESAHRLMERYYESLRTVIEVHGGTVVKLLGDGVMAAFGVPQVAEDDAIRAIRAGVAMQEAFRALVREQAAALGAVGLRIAINTGEVVVSSANDDVVGDPVNVAARLQQEAHDGDVVIGEATQRLVSTVVTLEKLGSFGLKGRAEPVKAYRVASLERPAGTAATPFVGREEEIARIRRVFEAAVAAPAARLVVLVGSPGLGKSRLVSEFVRRQADTAAVVFAQCHAAGSATFAPLADAFRQRFGIDDGTSGRALRAAVEAGLPGEEADRARIVDGITSLLAGQSASPEETFFVVRRAFAALASIQPVVLVIDDLQWAEPLLLDLVEHLIQWGKSVPLLVLAGARPELRDHRSSLVTPGGLVADVVTLAGLDARAAMRLAASVIGAADLPAAVAAKVLATSEGNPLFVGELVRMLVEEGAIERQGDRWIIGAGLAELEMPPTIHALLAARIERLRPEDRVVLERAAVVGRQFSRSAVAELLPGAAADLDARLESLRRSELIERDTGWFLGEPGLRFHHLLIRDAAYRRVLKGTRAELHARFADWVQARAGDSVEHDETIGWHLEQAHQHLGELGPIDAQGRALGKRAASYLAAAANRALAGDDVSLAASLFGRALARLDADDPSRAELALLWCESLLASGEVSTADTAIAELARFIAESPRLRAWHTCFTSELTVHTAPQSLTAAADSVAAAAEELARLDDTAGEAKAHFVHAQALASLGQVGACEAALDKALAAARKAGDRRRANAVLAGAPLAALWGPSPVTRASGRCLDVVRVLRITQGAPDVEAVALSCQGVLEALRGRTAAARRMIATARTMVEELGVIHRLFQTDVFAARIDLLEGDTAAAERTLRSAYEGLRDLGLGTDAAQVAALLARALLEQGRADEAEQLSHESQALAGDDLKAAIAWRGVRAEALAVRGEVDAAVELARAAVEIAAATDAHLDHADARLALAAALRAAGRAQEADTEERCASELWEAKGATILAESSRSESARRAPTGATAEAPAATAIQAVPRRVRANAATELNARIEAAMRAHDLEGLDALLGGSLQTIEHPTGVQYGRDGVLETCRRMVRIPDLELRAEPLATLGDSLCLFRRVVTASGTSLGSFDVGSYETEHFVVNEIDEAGRLGRSEVFAPDRLGDAIACLYARYAERLPQGPARARASGAARAAAAMLTRSAQYRPEDGMVTDFEVVDHRTVGIGTVRGADTVSRSISAWKELSDEWGFRVDDVLALSVDGLLRRTTTFGTVRESGGEFETSAIALSVFGPDGRVTRYEMFEIGHETEALARFDEVTATAPVATLEFIGRRLADLDEAPFANAASRALSRTIRCFNSRDWDAMVATYAADHRMDDQRKLMRIEVAGRQFFENERWIFDLPGSAFEAELVATRGERLALCHVTFTAGDDDTGPMTVDVLDLVEVDGSGRRTALAVFDPDDFAAAYATLDRCFAAGDGRERPVAAEWSQIHYQALDRRNWEAVAACYAPAFVGRDHRLVGWGTLEGPAAFLPTLRTMIELAPDARIRVDHMRTTERGALYSNMWLGSRDGGAFESPFLGVLELDDSRLARRLDFYDPHHLHAALARFEEVRGASAPPPAPHAPFANAATRMNERFVRAWKERDFETLSGPLTPARGYDDRRKLMQADPNPRAAVAGTRFLFDVPNSRMTVTPIATRGERLVLSRAVFEGTVDDEGGALAIDYLAVDEVDEQGASLICVFSDIDDLDAAYEELDRRYVAQEEAAHRTVASRFLATTRMIETGAWSDLEAMLPPSFHIRDHRELGWGMTLDSPATFVRSQRALSELAPDARYRVDHLRVSGRAHFCHFTQMGTRDGGEFENPMLNVGAWDASDQPLYYDLYDVEDYDAALAQFEALSSADARRSLGGAGTAIPIANEASAAMERWQATFATGFETEDWDPTRRICAPGMTFEDRQRFSLISGDCELMIASARERVVAGARPHSRVIGSAGDRIVMSRMLWSGGPIDGRFEIEYYALMEADESGLISAIVLMDADDPGAVLREAWARWQAIDPVATRWVEVASRSVAEFQGRLSNPTGNLFAESLVVDDHRLGGFGRIEGAQAYFDAVAVLWDLAPDTRLEVGWAWPAYDHRAAIATVRRTGHLASGGKFESEYLILYVLDGRLVTRVELFDAGHLDRALGRFEELRGETDLSTARSSQSIPWNAAIRAGERVAAFITASGDWEGARAFYADDFEYEDRSKRSLARGGFEELIAGVRYLVAEVGAQGWHEYLGTVGDRIAIAHRAWRNAPGMSDFELDKILVTEVDAQGKFRAVILFDGEDRAAAFAEAEARGEERDHAPKKAAPDDPLRIPPNAVTRTLDRWCVAVEARDVATAMALNGPALVVDDRRSLIRTTTGFEAEQRNIETIIQGGGRPTRTLLATAGDRLALHRWLWTFGEANAPSEVEFLEIDEVDDEGRFVWSVILDPDDRAGAWEALWNRYSDSGDRTADFLLAANGHDLGRMRATLRDDFVLEDHRRTGMGRLESPEAYVASFAAVVDELSTDYRMELLYVAASADHGSVTVGRACGTNAAGGVFESIIVTVAIFDGDKICRFEWFEPEDLDRALARLEDLRP
jgi:class 3 adenylate cyclase/ketosteroid isomerase-like protein/tetratricopeptide (TPR) repeat protein